MPSKSKSQQRLFGQVHNCQKNGVCSSEKIKKIASSIDAKDAEDFARTKHKGLPDRIEESVSAPKSRFRSFKNLPNSWDKNFATGLRTTQVRSNVQRRTNQLAQSSENERNFLRKSKTVWDVLAASNLPPAQVMKIARGYIQQFNQNQQGQQDQQGV